MKLTLISMAAILMTSLAFSQANDPNNNCNLDVKGQTSPWTGYCDVQYFCEGSCSTTKACKLVEDTSHTNTWCAGCGAPGAKPGCCFLVAVIAYQNNEKKLLGFASEGGCGKADCPVPGACSVTIEKHFGGGFRAFAGCTGSATGAPK